MNRPSSFLDRTIASDPVELLRPLVQRWQRLELLPENIASDVPDRVLDLVRRMLPCGYREHLVQFLQSEFCITHVSSVHAPWGGFGLG